MRPEITDVQERVDALFDFPDTDELEFGRILNPNLKAENDDTKKRIL